LSTALHSLALDDAQIELMRRIKDAFDPNHILNPGKMFPDWVGKSAQGIVNHKVDLKVKSNAGYLNTGCLIGLVLGSVLGMGVGAVTTYGPTRLLLKNCERLWGGEFAKVHPNEKWVVVIYPILLVSISCGMLYVVMKTTVWLEFVSLFFLVFQMTCVMITGVGILNGLFEILTGVSPVLRGRKGYFNAPWLHQYIYSDGTVERVRMAGVVRVLLGLLVILLSFLTSSFVSYYRLVF
jgi:hypothetical protein